MFLSKLRLQNWRSYEDATFDFKKPTQRKPLCLVGGMNGHGKTSLLISLYLGLFGRYGLRHCEGFSTGGESDYEFYRGALAQFRRNAADHRDPTEIELIFTPTLREQGGREVRLVRRWHFTTSQKLKQGQASEEVEVQEDGEPRHFSGNLDYAHAWIERTLFPAHIAPAFFFDGEQAQTLITTAGTQGLQKSVEVMFGTKIVAELNERIGTYIATTSSRMGGRKKAGEKERQLQEKEQKREALNQKIAHLEAEWQSLTDEKEQLERVRTQTREQLARLGGDRRTDAHKLHEELTSATTERDKCEQDLLKCVQRIGLSLALSRLHTPIVNRLRSEKALEEWENLKSGTLAKADQVLAVAMPEPPSQDELLGYLAPEIREKVKQRFKSALARIYNPPPSDCASFYLLGHVRGDSRNQALELLETAISDGAIDVQGKTRRLQSAYAQYDEAKTRFDQQQDTPADVDKLKTMISEQDDMISEAMRKLGEIDSEIKALKSQLHDLNVQVTRLCDEIALLEPEQRKIAVAERVRSVSSELIEKLRPLAFDALQDKVTQHFTSIADKRFRNGKIVFPTDSQVTPMFVYRDERQQAIESMGGFERRTFGISFSLALAEITGRRLPLVIDTPLGNADSEYRPRLMKALTDIDLDQVIILTHDQEVTPDLLQAFEKNVAQKILVEFDGARHSSIVYHDRFFGGSNGSHT